MDQSIKQDGARIVLPIPNAANMAKSLDILSSLETKTISRRIFIQGVIVTGLITFLGPHLYRFLKSAFPDEAAIEQTILSNGSSATFSNIAIAGSSDYMEGAAAGYFRTGRMHHRNWLK